MKNILLKRIKITDNEVIKEFYKWSVEEKNWFLYTCRPLKNILTFDKYSENLKNRIKIKSIYLYYLFDEELKKVLGKITLFDYNHRNKSAEFGYYLPKKYRKKGYGKIMINKFLSLIFELKELELNKIYATTCSSNHASINLLIKQKFILEGRLKDHYWINEKKYDQIIFAKFKQ